MGKRLSKVRRAKELNRSLVIARAKQADDSHLMQQGSVRCALARPATQLAGLKMPRQSEGHVKVLDHRQKARSSPHYWSFDYTKVKGYKPAGD